MKLSSLFFCFVPNVGAKYSMYENGAKFLFIWINSWWKCKWVFLRISITISVDFPFAFSGCNCFYVQYFIFTYIPQMFFSHSAPPPRFILLFWLTSILYLMVFHWDFFYENFILKMFLRIKVVELLLFFFFFVFNLFSIVVFFKYWFYLR